MVALSAILHYRGKEGWPPSAFPVICKETADISLQRGPLPSEVHILLPDTALTHGINSSFQVRGGRLSL